MQKGSTGQRLLYWFTTVLRHVIGARKCLMRAGRRVSMNYDCHMATYSQLLTLPKSPSGDHCPLPSAKWIDSTTRMVRELIEVPN